MSEMTRTGSGWFRYITPASSILQFGVAVSAGGVGRIRPKTRYPASNHPPHRFFDWERGRVLDALQIVCILRGRGRLETASGTVVVQAGMTFLILPGCWHRYRPDPETGWTECWVELEGQTVDSLCGAGMLTKMLLGRREVGRDFPLRIREVHRRLRLRHAALDRRLPALALDLLTHVSGSQHASIGLPPARRLAQEAMQMLEEKCQDDVNLTGIAARFGVSYSLFRRMFRKETGISPWQFVLRCRLRLAKRILAWDSITLDQAAEQTGFSSGFHLSKAFKKCFGESPESWRRRRREEPLPPA